MKFDKNNKSYLLFTFFHLLSNTFTEEFRKVYEPVKNLNYNHIKTLLSIRYSDYKTMGEISDDTGLEKGSFTAIAERLISLGYIKKVQSAEDKRVNMLIMSEKGKQFADELSLAHYEYMESLLSNLTVIEREVWESCVKVMKKLIKKINNIEIT